MTKVREGVVNTSGHRPIGNRVLVKLKPVEEKSKAGIIVNTETQLQKEEMAQMESVVIALGATAFRDPELEAVNVGDRVMIAKYAGYLLDKDAALDGQSYRIIRDKDILDVIEGEQS